LFVEKTGATLLSGASSDLYVFTNGIKGTGPMGFQASIGSTNVGDEFYSPLWRIQAVTWKDPSYVNFLSTSKELTSEGSKGYLTTAVAGVIVNCPFVEVDEKFMMDNKMMEDKMMKEKESTMMKMEHIDSPLKQMRMGIDAHKIQCKSGYSNVFRAADWSPACVKPSSVERLVEIGWASNHMPSNEDLMKKDSMMKDNTKP